MVGRSVYLTAPPSVAVLPPIALVSGSTLARRVEDFEREVILAELKHNHGHITNTAKALGLERSHPYKKAHQLGIDLKGGGKAEA